MDVDMAWRRKRPIEDGEYLESKRFLSEHFFNMRISQPQRAGMCAVRSASQGSMGAGSSTNRLDTQDSMVDVDLSTGTPYDSARLAHPRTASTTAKGGDVYDKGDDDDEDFDDEPPAPPLSRGNSEGSLGTAGGRPTPHPFVRTASCAVDAVDDKVDDWVRSSRHRLLADASVDSAPDLCRALILYKPLPRAGVDGEEDGSGGEGGGDPTPPPRSDGDETGVSSSRAHGKAAAVNVEQSAGSGTAEAAGSTGGGGSSGLVFNGGNGVSGGMFGPRHSAACVAPSGGDDAGGAMSDGSEGEDAMDTTTAEDNDGDLGQEMPAEASVLTRTGTSRGLPTPELTPEWAARARMASSQQPAQDPGESAGGPRVPPLPSEVLGCW